jgi:hypothetical protein
MIFDKIHYLSHKEKGMQRFSFVDTLPICNSNSFASHRIHPAFFFLLISFHTFHSVLHLEHTLFRKTYVICHLNRCFFFSISSSNSFVTNSLIKSLLYLSIVPLRNKKANIFSDVDLSSSIHDILFQK